MDVEDLPAAIQLSADRIAHEAVVVLRDAGLDRQARLGRRLDHAQVADADEAEVERARDRRGAQGQHVDLTPHRLDPLLVGHAEPLLLVDDEEAEIGEADVLAEDPMRPDEDVDGTVGDAGDDLVLALARHEAAQHRDLDREGGEATLERVEVLLRQDGRGNEHRHLLAVLHRLECGAQRDLGLAVADVTDHQAVHGPAAEHVGLDLLDAARLVGRLGVREALLELPLPGRVGAEGEAGRRFARRVDLDQLASEVADRASDARLRALPLGPAELAERRCRTSGVARDAPDLVGWEEDLVRPGEVELEILLDVIAERALGHPDVPSDAVVDVDDVVAGLELADEVSSHHALATRQSPHARRAEELAVGQHEQATRLVPEPRTQGSVDQRHLSSHRCRAELGDRRGRTAGLVEQLADTAGLVGADEHRALERQLGEPRAGPIGAAGNWGRRGVARIGRSLLLQCFAGLHRQDLEGAERVVRGGPPRRQLARADETGEAVRSLAVEVGGQGAELLGVGEDGVS